MNQTWRVKCATLIIFTGIALTYVAPTILGLNLEKSSFPIKKKVNLGLDLQGGVSMVYGIDFQKVYQEILNRQIESLTQSLSNIGSPVTLQTLANSSVSSGSSDSDLTADPHVQILFPETSKEAIRKSVKAAQALRIVEDSSRGFSLGLSRHYRDEIRNNTLAQSIEVIRNRVDEFGVTEPSISSQGEDRVVVELPGVKEINRAKQLVGRTAKLEFKIVNDKAMSQDQLAHLISDIESQYHLQYNDGQRFSEYVAKVNELARSKIPDGSEIAFERGSIAGDAPKDSQVQRRVPYLLFSKTDVTGKDLRDAQVSLDQENHAPIVSFELNASGARTFEKLTGEHRGERLAIVLDNVIHSAPVIQSQIGGGRGQITLGRGGGDERLKEAKDLAIVLRAGALPAQLELLEQRVIGPTLGQDSIKQGLRAALVGCALVFMFMVYYYRMSGVVAVISLLLNGLFAFAILIGMDATLTLPGIAGLALVIGMAVDSNVIIFERIREELEEGKNPSAAIESGFNKAFTSIFDANITHGIIGLILLNFGTGPIKGFAVMLLIGIVTTLFTAVTVCKLIFDGYVSWMHGKHRKIEKLSI